MNQAYPFIPYDQILEWLPTMKRLGISQKARSKGQFIDQYRTAGSASRLSLYWHRKRNGFIARHLAQYKKKPTLRRRIALIAWAFNPDI